MLWCLNEHFIPASSLVDISVSALKIVYKWRDIKMRAASKAVIEPAPKEVHQILDAVRYYPESCNAVFGGFFWSRPGFNEGRRRG